MNGISNRAGGPPSPPSSPATYAATRRIGITPAFGTWRWSGTITGAVTETNPLIRRIEGRNGSEKVVYKFLTIRIERHRGNP
jgi:hypothetical protein